MEAECVAAYLTVLVRATKASNAAAVLRGMGCEPPELLAAFDAVAACPVCIHDYALRLLNHAAPVASPRLPLQISEAECWHRCGCDDESLGQAHITGTIACMLIHRLLARHASHWGGVSETNVHRLFLTSLLVATKLVQDGHQLGLLPAASAAGGVETEELAQLEINFLFALGFDCHVTAEDLQRFAFAHCRSSSPSSPKMKRMWRAMLAVGGGVPLVPLPFSLDGEPAMA
eukprot:TRINITY_DN3636_c0_g1_i1.p1 TRINITY_DN3636_c0_g1~~TRINITY_DN3636_c0_g1_i1.p1  ORF type:complete len:231 (+),score=60.25 TRINITY_DN3636_c0_g1_i1:112-804(+)